MLKKNIFIEVFNSIQKCKNIDDFFNLLALMNSDAHINIYKNKKLFDNILEASMDAFYIKIMRFAGFLCIHSWNATFREPCSPLHQGKEQPEILSPDTELFLRIVPFYIYITLFVGVVKGKKRMWKEREGRGRRNRSVFDNRENDFPYFIYVAAISRLLGCFCISMLLYTFLESMM